MTAALVDDLAGVGVEFEQVCEYCNHVAEWMVWVKHALRNHDERTGFLCATCKERTEDRWCLALEEGWACLCGHRHEGQLSDNFRALLL